MVTKRSFTVLRGRRVAYSVGWGEVSTAERHRNEAELLRSILSRPIVAYPRNTGPVREAWKEVAESNNMSVTSARLMFRAIKNRYLTIRKREKKRKDCEKEWVHLEAMKRLEVVAKRHEFVLEEQVEHLECSPQEQLSTCHSQHHVLPTSPKGNGVSSAVHGGIEEALREQLRACRTEIECLHKQSRACRTEIEGLRSGMRAMETEIEILRKQNDKSNLALELASVHNRELEGKIEGIKYRLIEVIGCETVSREVGKF